MGLILIGLLVIAAIVDIHCYRIPNLCVGGGIAAGTIMTWLSEGILGLIQVFIQAAVIFAVFYPFFLIRGLGAGDIKLFMMTGFYFRREDLYVFITITFILAGLISICKMLRYKESRERLYYLGGYIRKILITRTIDEYEAGKLMTGGEMKREMEDEVKKETNRRKVIRLSIPALLSAMIITVF